MNQLYRFCLFGLLLLLWLPGQATHLVGGQLEVRAVGDIPGHFVVTVTNYFEDNPAAQRVSEAAIGIFRKRDNALMTSFLAYESGRRSSIIYANSFCATQRNLNFITATFSADIKLPAAQYTDAQGYYVSYQTRNRNGGINNLVNPIQTGYTFYLEMPPLTTTGKYIHNSSPQFPAINGEYVCLGDPFTYAFGGTDPDGDELRYSMETPLTQRTNNGVLAGPYPKVNYEAGFSATNAIPGSPTLAVDERTGQLSVTATQTGLFVFAVRVDEFRNGQKIGEVRRDFQLLVVDCPRNQAPDPQVQIGLLPATVQKTTLCPGTSTTLTATPNPAWNYQWQRDGLNLPNATDNTLQVSDKGEYSVAVSLKGICAKESNAQSLTINVIDANPTLTPAGQLCATDGSVRLRVSAQPDVVYQWLWNGQPITGAADSLLTTNPGTFQVVMTHQTLGCQARTPPIQLARASAVLAALQSTGGLNRVCPADPLTLLGSGGVQYQWAQNGALIAAQTGSTYTTQTAGTYSLTAIAGNGCRGIAPPLTVSAVAPVTPLLDSLPPFCGPDAPALRLTGTPAGGVYSGVGTSGNQFSPRTAGIGQFTITYAVRPAPECSPVQTSRQAIVYPIPTIAMPEDGITFRGNSLTLQPPLTGNPIRYQWTPTTAITNPTGPIAEITDIRQTTTYTLRIENAGRCAATDSVRISVVDHLFAPDAFTPNGDGMNDSWKLVNLAAYPLVDVTIFNRWGSVIFHETGANQPAFDGKLAGTDVPDGVYTYVIRPDPKLPPMQGRLILMR